jgi:hypothetical protein
MNESVSQMRHYSRDEMLERGIVYENVPALH